jgi:hypothetical protein
MAGMETKLNEPEWEDEKTAIDQGATAVAAIVLMEKLEGGRPFPAPSISRAFRLSRR